MFNPRPAQAEILCYTKGLMGISAVPGSGKTHTLSALAANLIINNPLEDDQEILIVTLVNSAVDNFATRISSFLTQNGLLPDLGYRVRTLHGLAHDIVRERPDLVGLSDRFTIVDEREANDILNSSTQAWLRGHPILHDTYFDADIPANRVSQAEKDWPEVMVNVARSIIRTAKDRQITPDMLQRLLAEIADPHPLLVMGSDVYTSYQQALNYRSAVDFDDLIRMALAALNADPAYLDRLRYRWPFILEDEAQDSSRLQEEILRLLTGQQGNWVRVGDPNQAIYETFTTASPQYLMNFLKEEAVTPCSLPNSGRSTESIITLANHLVDWVREFHPHIELQEALTLPHIQPTPPDDPQPNPTDNPQAIFIDQGKPLDSEGEINWVIRSVARWLPDHQDSTVAILTPRNFRGAEVVEALKKANLPYVELLQSSLTTRQTAQLLAQILRLLADPGNPTLLANCLQAMLVRHEESSDQKLYAKTLAEQLKRCVRTEEFLYAQPGQDWLDTISPQQLPMDQRDELVKYREQIIRWQQASLLPVDQLVLTIAQDLFIQPSDLALTHKIALLLDHDAGIHPDWRLLEFSQQLEAIAHNERKLAGFTDEDSGFDPEAYKGKVVVATIHKAKGLEWDRVYLMSVNNYDFPSMEDYDTYISEKWYIRNQLNLEAEAVSRLMGIIQHDPFLITLPEGDATRAARIEYCAERLRLLYVGITRARRELCITWNTGRNGRCLPAIPLTALQSFWKERSNRGSSA